MAPRLPLNVVEQIVRGSNDGRKTYTFNDGHDYNLPAQWWFQESHEGLILFLVFYTQACQWSRCLACNLPSRMSKDHVSYKAVISQIDWVFANPEIMVRKDEIRKVILSNNGSVLDQETFSTTALMYLMAKLNLNFRWLDVISLETRPEYVDLAEIVVLSRAAAEGDTPTRIELAVGFEVFDDHIRNDVLMKGLHLAVFEKMVTQATSHGFRIKCYLMQKPVPGMSDEEAIKDVECAIEYLHRVSESCGALINVHLNPTYVARNTDLEVAFLRGEYVPPFLSDVAKAALAGRGKSLTMFIGLYDEGLAVPGGSFIRDERDEGLVAVLEQFNRTQNFEVIESML
ncbi:TPA: hypothetical protein DF272_06560 [Candidatus Falkowbacteria bacterium]|nr:hypothetical protein [Candidatus Falkowbacteria bacterium]